MDRQTSNIVLILLAVIAALAIIGLLGMWLMPSMMGGMMGGSGMMSCCGGRMGLWIFGLFFVAVIVVISILLVLRK
jgi:uncharacterized membrane protein